MPTKLFIIGTGRCGTHTLTRILQNVPNTCSLHEGKGVLMGEEFDMNDMKGLNIYLYHSFNKENALKESYSLSGQTLNIMNDNFAERHQLIRDISEQGIHFCEANRLLYNYINYIYKKYPDAKFIHLVRNGYDCVRSWFSRPSVYREKSSVYNNVIFFMANEIWTWLGLTEKRRIERLAKSNFLDVQDVKVLCSKNSQYQYDKPLPYKTDKWFNEWEFFDRVQKISWFWQYTNNLITQRLKQLPPSQSMVIKVEDISPNKPEKILEILRFAELPESFSLKTLKAYDKKYHSSFEWTQERIEKFNRIADSCMKYFGYQLR